jgi:hypothetical protein
MTRFLFQISTRDLHKRGLLYPNAFRIENKFKICYFVSKVIFLSFVTVVSMVKGCLGDCVLPLLPTILI